MSTPGRKTIAPPGVSPGPPKPARGEGFEPPSAEPKSAALTIGRPSNGAPAGTRPSVERSSSLELSTAGDDQTAAPQAYLRSATTALDRSEPPQGVEPCSPGYEAGALPTMLQGQVVPTNGHLGARYAVIGRGRPSRKTCQGSSARCRTRRATNRSVLSRRRPGGSRTTSKQNFRGSRV